MSRERCLSLDRGYRRHQDNDFYSGFYYPEGSPNRNSSRFYFAPHNAPSTPDIYHRNYGGAGQDGSFENDSQYDMPNETLDDYNEPPFHEEPLNNSFDEIRCILATPPRAQQTLEPTAAQQLDAFRAEVAEVIGHSRAVAEQNFSVQVDDIGRRVVAALAAEIPPLPEDPHAIPPPPKDPKDVVAIIRRAKAIARLKSVEEAKAPSRPAGKKPTRGVPIPKRPMKQKPTLPIPKSGTAKPMRQLPTVPKPRPGTTKPVKKDPNCPKRTVPKPMKQVPTLPKPRADTKQSVKQAPCVQKPKSATTKPIKQVPTCPKPKPVTTKPVKQVPNLPKLKAGPTKPKTQPPTLPKPKAGSTKPMKNVPTCPKSKGAIPKVPTCPKSKGAIPKVPTCPKSKGAIPKVPICPKSKGAIPKVPTCPKSKGAIPKVPICPKSKGAIPKVPTCPKSKGAIPKQAPVAKPLPCPSRKSPDPRTLEGIKRRVSQIRERSSAAAAAALVERNISYHNPQDELDDLDEFEALEELYGADKTAQSVSIVESVSSLQVRVDFLQQQLLKTPPAVDPMDEELDDFEALEQQYGAASNNVCPDMEYNATYLKDRINTLQQNLQSPEAADSHRQYDAFDNMDIPDFNINDISQFAFSPEAMENADFRSASQVSLDKIIDFPEQNIDRRRLAAYYAVVGESQLRTPRQPPCPHSSFDDAVLENIDIPEFDINDISLFAFSAEAMENADFQSGSPIFLQEIPDVDEDISFEERGLQDVSCPDLRDMSTGDEPTEEDDEPTEEDDETTEEDEDVVTEQREEIPQSGFLTGILNAVVGSFRNIFSPSAVGDGQQYGEETETDLDSSLPNLFETCPETKTPPQKLEQPIEQKPLSPKRPIAVPPHPKNPKDYASMVKRARAIQKKKAEEKAKICAPPTKEKRGKREIKTVRAPLTKERKGKKEVKSACPPPSKESRKKREIKSTIPKSAPPSKKKIPVEKPKKKVRPPGQHSPSYVKAIARARSLAGLKNISEQLNPEIAEELAKRKAAEEAEIAQRKAAEEEEQKALEALPLIERMTAQMKKMRDSMGGLPRPSIASIDVIATIEAIRESLPKPEIKKKWRPTGRLRADFRVKPSERIFRRDFGRVLIPTEKTQKKKGWKELDVMSPIVEEPDEDMIYFSPLKPQEGQARLRYLREQAERRAAEESMRAEEDVSETSSQSFETPENLPEYSPIQLRSPSGPRTEETKSEKIVTQVGPHGGTETIREEVTETSMIENGEVHKSTRKVTTTTDEYGEVTCHVQEGNGVSGEEADISEDLSYIEPPEILDTSDRPPPRDPSVPVPKIIITKVRSEVQQGFNIPQSSRSPPYTVARMLDLPQELPDDELCDTESPELSRTPKTSPRAKAISPVVKDPRMYVLGERPPVSPPPRSPTPPRISTPQPAEPATHSSPAQKSKSPEGAICIPPHPKDPKDYKAIIKRALAIFKLKKQQAQLDNKPGPSKQPHKKGGRVPISRWVKPPPKDPKKPPRKKLVLKKRVPKKVDEYENEDGPEEVRPLPQKYVGAVARARLIRGLKNRTAALNPQVAAKQAAKKAAQEAARAAFEALPEKEKIKKRMERFRKLPAKKRRIKPSAEILGTIAAIKENIPQIILQPPTPPRSPPPQQLPVSPREMSPKTPTRGSYLMPTPQAPVRRRARATTPVTPDEISDTLYYQEMVLALEQNLSGEAIPDVPVQEADEDDSQPYISSEQVQGTPLQRAASHRLQPCISPENRLPSPADDLNINLDLSLADFEKIESEINQDISLDEFEALEAEMEAEAQVEVEAQSEAENIYYETPIRFEHHMSRHLVREFSPSPRPVKNEPCTPAQQEEIIDLCTPSPTRPSPEPQNVPRRNLRPPPNLLPICEPEPQIVPRRNLRPPPDLLPICEPEPQIVPRPNLRPPPDLRPICMRTLVEAGFFDEMFGQLPLSVWLPSEEFLRNANYRPDEIDPDDIEDLIEAYENYESPPKTIQERFQRVKRAQERQAKTPPRQPEQADDGSGSPCYSPITIQSPKIASDDETDRSILYDDLEYETEISMTEVSIDSKTPLPSGSEEVIRTIKAKVDQQLRQRTYSTARAPSPRTPTPVRQPTPYQRTYSTARALSPERLALPDEFPYEEMLELCSPSFAQTPKTPPVKYRSPRVSLPMALGEVRPVTPVTPVVCPPPRTPTPVREPTPCPQQGAIRKKIPSPEGPIVIPPHPKDKRDYAAIVKRALAIHKLKQQEEAEAPSQEPPKPKRQPISRWVGGPPKRISAKPKKKLVLRKPVPKPAEPAKKEVKKPMLPKKPKRSPGRLRKLSRAYIDPVARARSIHGLKNTTAALNPEYAKQVAAKKAAKEAAIAAYNALPEFEKIKIRMQRLRKKPQARRRRIKPTMEQKAYVEALKQTDYRARTPPPRCPTPTPRELAELAEFENLEQLYAPQVCPPAPSQDVALEQRIANLEQQLLEVQESPQIGDASLAEFEALEQQLLPTPPPRIDPREKYRQLLTQRKTPKTPVVSPVKTPEIRYSPVQLHQSARGRTVEAELEPAADLEVLEDPNNLARSPLTPTQRLIPIEVIQTVHKKIRHIFRPEVPTGQLVELRTPPRLLPLPAEIPEEQLLKYSCPRIVITSPQSPVRSPVRSPTRSPIRSADVSLPQVFKCTPPRQTLLPPPSRPQKRRTPTSEGPPSVIPPHPKNPNDFKGMVKRARKIQELIEKEYQAAKQSEAVAATAAANKAKRKERVPISRWTAPPPKKPVKSKKLVMKKRAVPAGAQATRKECPAEPPPLPQNFAKEVAIARKLAGLKNKTAALNPKKAAKEAAKAAALNAPPQSPAKDYATVLSKMVKIKEKGMVARGQPSLQAFAYIEAVKDAIQVHQQQQQQQEQQQHVDDGAHSETAKSRYERVRASRSVVQPTIEASPIITPPEDIPYSPVPYVSPRIGDGQNNLAESLRQMNAAASEILNELNDLCELEEQAEQNEDQYVPSTPTRMRTRTPPVPSTIVGRIRQQYEQQNVIVRPERKTITPEDFNFAEDLPEEELLELSSPVNAQSPFAAEPPIRSPNISLPHLFERSPVPTREKTPTPRRSRSPTAGVCPEQKVKTPERPIKIPAHPKNPKDVAAMVKRAQLIQKQKAKEDAKKVTAAKATKTRVPISRRVPAKPVPKKEPLTRKIVPKKKYGDPNTKTAKSRAPKECPKDPPKLPAKYVEQVARARKIAGIKSKPAAKQQTKTKAPLASVTAASLIATLRKGKQNEQKALTSRELSQRQRLINLQQKEERKRLLKQLEQLREQEFEFEPKTPPGAQERLEAIKSRTGAKPTAYRYSPVKTPEAVDIQYEPIAFPQTSPYQFLENANISDIEDISMQFDDFDNIANLGFMEINENDISESQGEDLANAEDLANEMENEIAEYQSENNFDIADNIEMLERQIIDSANRPRKNRIEILEHIIIPPPIRNIANVREEYNMANRMRQLQVQLLETSYKGPEAEERYDEDNQDYDQNIIDESMDEFEAMERECL